MILGVNFALCGAPYPLRLLFFVVVLLDLSSLLPATRTACTAEEEASLVRSFEEFDRDGNGYLTLEEVVEVMERRGYPSIFARVSSSKN